MTDAPVARPVHPNSTPALVLGILSVLLCGVFTGIPGIILGARGLREVRDSYGAIDPGALKAGLVLSIIGTAYTALIIVIMIVAVVVLVIAGPHMPAHPYVGSNA